MIQPLRLLMRVLGFGADHEPVAEPAPSPVASTAPSADSASAELLGSVQEHADSQSGESDLASDRATRERSTRRAPLGTFPDLATVLALQADALLQVFSPATLENLQTMLRVFLEEVGAASRAGLSQREHFRARAAAARVAHRAATAQLLDTHVELERQIRTIAWAFGAGVRQPGLVRVIDVTDARDEIDIEARIQRASVAPHLIWWVSDGIVSASVLRAAASGDAIVVAEVRGIDGGASSAWLLGVANHAIVGRARVTDGRGAQRVESCAHKQGDLAEHKEGEALRLTGAAAYVQALLSPLSVASMTAWLEIRPPTGFIGLEHDFTPAAASDLARRDLVAPTSSDGFGKKIVLSRNYFPKSRRVNR